ncbi:MBL fold metallo-hydrolase [Muribaculum intestinale]|uniref:MBL fold metallo-hydrolase n=1 Tax=Muribaculum intestinale TaxID=1796646 RepID=UPI003F494B1C
MTENITLRFLGTGTSTGVPAIGCTCPACLSTDTRDKRLRSSAIVSVGDKNLLIDCGPDFRRQIIDAGAPHLEAVLLTHSHYDHVGGIDDMRPYCHSLPDGHFPVYCTVDVAEDLRNRVPYCFRENLYPGVPVFSIHEVDPKAPFMVGDIQVTPLPVMHDRLPIIGFRIGPLAYITDAKTIPESTFSLLEGVDTLVINALRHVPHHSHMSVGEALAVVDRLKPRAVYFTHIADALGPHASVAAALPPPVRLAYDGLSISFKL